MRVGPAGGRWSPSVKRPEPVDADTVRLERGPGSSRWRVLAGLAAEQCPVEQDRGRLAVALRRRCRRESVETAAGTHLLWVVRLRDCCDESMFGDLFVDVEVAASECLDGAGVSGADTCE